MAEFKVVIADPKTGKCYKHEVKGPEATRLVGMKIGEKLAGEAVGFPGYELEITGGSDYCGFPMRKDLNESGRRRIYTVRSQGVRNAFKGERVRKSVAGNTIYAKTAQINMKVLKYGAKPLSDDKAAEKPAEKPGPHAEKKEEKKEEKAEKKEEKKEVKAEKKAEKKEEKAEKEKKE
jgi:small subunit ribosomal protein S6e